MMRLITVLFLLCIGSTPTFAQNYGLPALFNVTGVASNDTLNIRQNPSSNSADIGDLAFNEQRVEVIEVDDTGKWGLIRMREGRGWVSMRYMQQLPRDYVAGHVIEKGMLCIGVEPFWSVAFLPNGLVEFSDSYPAIEHLPFIWSGIAVNRVVWPIGFTASDGQQSLNGVLNNTSCSDGMSDNPYGIQIDLIVNRNGSSRMLSGCCALNIGN